MIRVRDVGNIRSTDIILSEQSVSIEMSLRVASQDRKNN
jgi:hypothetical protein